jgi:hypothetical protein
MRLTALIMIVSAAGAIVAFLAIKAPEYLPLLFGIAFFFLAATMLRGIAGTWPHDLSTGISSRVLV